MEFLFSFFTEFMSSPNKLASSAKRPEDVPHLLGQCLLIFFDLPNDLF